MGTVLTATNVKLTILESAFTKQVAEHAGSLCCYAVEVAANVAEEVTASGSTEVWLHE